MDFELPADLTTLSVEELRALRAEARQAFNGLRASGQASASIEALRDLREATVSIDTELSARAEADAAVEAELAEMADVFGDEDEGDDAGEEAPAADDGDAGDGDDGDDSDDDEPADEAGDDDGDEGDEAPADEAPVVASGPRRISLPEIAAGQSTEVLEGEIIPAATLTAAAGMPGHNIGDTLDMSAFAASLAERLPSLRASGPGSQTQVTLGQIDIPFPEELTISGTDATEVVEYAAREDRLEGGSLTAAGGWCAPGEILYQLCPGLETNSGLISVPEVRLTRGSAQFFGGFDFSDVFGDGFCFTGQDDIDGLYAPGANPGDPNVAGPKPCITVPCLDTTNVELGGCGLCIQTGLLQARAFPESIRRFIEVSLVAHRHRINADIIAKMEAAATPVAFPVQPGATAHLLGSLELIIEHNRHKYRMSPNATLEVVLPYWVRGVIRTDLAKRVGVMATNISNSDISAHLSRRGARVQWVYDWQDNFVDATIEMGGDTPPTSWPDSVKMLVYPAGTFVKWTGGEVRIDMIVDQDLVLNNNRHELFLEEFYELTPRCHEAFVLDVGLCPDGSTQAGVDLACDAA